MIKTSLSKESLFFKIKVLFFLILFFMIFIIYGGEFKEIFGSGLESIVYFVVSFFALLCLKLVVPSSPGTIVKLFFVYFSYIVVLSLSRSIFEGFYNFPSYVMYFSFFIMIGFAFFSGYGIYSRWGRRSISIWIIFLFFFISILTFFLSSEMVGFYINKNWAALSVVFFMMFRVLVNRRIYFLDRCFFLINAFVSLVIFDSQGVALASFVIFFTSFFNNPFNCASRRILLIGGYSFVLSAVIFPFCIAWLLNQPYGEAFSAWWSLTFDERLGSGRVEYWIAIVEMADIKSIFWGHGLDATIAELSKGELANVSTHNLFVEVFLRAGGVGVIFLLVFFLFIIKKLIKNKRLEMVSIALGLIILGSVYAVGGFTHWPGTIFVWVLLGLLAGLSSSPKSVSDPRGRGL